MKQNSSENKIKRYEILSEQTLNDKKALKKYSYKKTKKTKD